MELLWSHWHRSRESFLIILLLSIEGRVTWAIIRDIGCVGAFLVMRFGGLGRDGGGGGSGCIGGSFLMLGCMVWWRKM